MWQPTASRRARSSRPDEQDPVVLGAGVAAAVAVGGGDPEVAVGGGYDGTQPAVLPDEERLLAAGLLPGDVDPPEPLAPERPEPEMPVEERQPGRGRVVGAPLHLRVGEVGGLAALALGLGPAVVEPTLDQVELVPGVLAEL